MCQVITMLLVIIPVISIINIILLFLLAVLFVFQQPDILNFAMDCVSHAGKMVTGAFKVA